MLQLDPKLLKKTGVFSLVLTELGVYVGAGLFAGRWLDQKVELSPLFTSILVLAGLVLAIFRIRYWLRKEIERGQ